MTTEESVEGSAEPHLTPEQVKTVLGFVQQESRHHRWPSGQPVGGADVWHRRRTGCVRRDDLDHPIRQAAASILILNCYIEHELSDPENKQAVRRAQDALHELGYIVRDMHVGKPTELEFGGTLDPEWILRKYREDNRLHPRLRENQIQGSLDMIEERRELATKRRAATEQREARRTDESGGATGPSIQ